jgi:hypothetical protein
MAVVIMQGCMQRDRRAAMPCMKVCYTVRIHMLCVSCGHMSRIIHWYLAERMGVV